MSSGRGAGEEGGEGSRGGGDRRWVWEKERTSLSVSGRKDGRSSVEVAAGAKGALGRRKGAARRASCGRLGAEGSGSGRVQRPRGRRRWEGNARAGGRAPSGCPRARAELNRATPCWCPAEPAPAERISGSDRRSERNATHEARSCALSRPTEEQLTARRDATQPAAASPAAASRTRAHHPRRAEHRSRQRRRRRISHSWTGRLRRAHRRGVAYIHPQPLSSRSLCHKPRR